MKILDFISYALNSLKERKVRAILTILGIVVGPATIISINSMVLGYSHTIISQISNFLSPYDIIVTPTGRGLPLSQYLILQLETIPGVKMVIPFYSFPALIRTPNGYEGATVFAVNINQLKLAAPAISLSSGYFPGTEVSYEASIGYQLGNPQGGYSPIRPNQVIQTIIFYNGNNFSKTFLVTGVLNEYGSFLGVDIDKSIIVPLSFGQSISSSYSGAIIIVNSLGEVNEVANEIKQKFGNSLDIVVAEEFIQLIDNTLQSLNGLLVSAGATSFIVSFMGVTTTMFTTVVERTKEIGILRALGFTKFDVLTMFLVEASVMGFIGSIIGLALGSVVALILTQEHFGLGFSFLKGLSVSPIYSPTFMLLVLIFSTMLSVIAALGPAYNASRLDPNKALRYE
ncbi:ABC transporter permease [Saccharolobus shibatae]|uniref:ABC-type antimicrobial peptide transport system, permease component n=1 Tax=Saccharolobus shibatae TaxID=2286 RepID=A0A8F5GXS3_9CREN|nr:FtsX-like permease family protein [Saccharolobus shibatae]QXJ32762.1 ABC-type antimicrobial peptide transport system, permease component [Saccharolobus shibatae]QXJ35891.1 ABC-type antimicrobial peptide transport system, permease component [Saccharolobus shibatae]